MVPDNIIWAAFSSFDYQNRFDIATIEGKPTPKDVYYQNTKGEWVKVTAVFDCIEKLRKNCNRLDDVYLGPVLSNTKGEVERGHKFPPVPENEKTSEQIRERMKKVNPNKYSKIAIKNASPISYWSISDPTISKWSAFDDDER